MYQKPKHTWNEDTVLEIVVTGRNVYDGITGHAIDFPVLGHPHPIADLETATKRLDDAYRDRDNGPLADLELINAKKAMITLLNDWAKYADKMAVGDPVIITKAGFVPTLADSHPAVLLPKPSTPLADGRSGGFIDARVVQEPGATNYVWVCFTAGIFDLVIANHQILLPANKGLILIPIAGSIVTFSGLTPMTEANVGVIASNAAGLSVLSNLKKVYTI